MSKRLAARWRGSELRIRVVGYHSLSSRDRSHYHLRADLRGPQGRGVVGVAGNLTSNNTFRPLSDGSSER